MSHFTETLKNGYVSIMWNVLIINILIIIFSIRPFSSKIVAELGKLGTRKDIPKLGTVLLIDDEMKLYILVNI